MLTIVNVQLTLVTGDSSLVPAYAKEGDAGCDAKANLKEPVQVLSRESAVIPLGIRVAIPEGYEIQVRPRSGLAAKYQVTICNSPGTIDENFRGELGAIIINHGKYPFTVHPGDRICQLVCNKVEQIKWEIVEDLPASNRGEDGFGSTGV